MPRRWLLAFIEMLPRIEAERALTLATAVMLPHLDQRRGNRARSEIITGWQRAATGRREGAGGPVVLRTGADFRRWLAQTGGINAEERRS